MNKKMLLAVLLCIMYICFSGCNEKPNTNRNQHEQFSDFIGTWNTSEPIAWYIKPSFTFLDNGSFLVGSVGGDFIVTEEKLQLNWNNGLTFNYSYDFLDKNTLSLTFFDTLDNGIYKRQ